MPNGNMGYTEDGLVFMAFDFDYKGEQIHGVVQWMPENAIEMAHELIKTAKACKDKKKEIDERDRLIPN